VIAPALAVLTRGLAVDPAARPVSANALVAELASALDIVLPRKTTARAVVRPRLRSSWLGAATSAVLVVALIALLATRSEGDSQRGTTASGVVTTVAGATTVVQATTTVLARRPATTVVGRAGAVPSATTLVPQVGRLAVFRPEGALEVDRILANGIEAQRSTTTPADKWTAIGRIREGKVMLYRAGDGYNKVTTVEPGGEITFGRTEDAQSGWSHVTGVDDGLLFFYRQSDGFAATIRFGEKDRLRDGDSYLEWRVSNAGYDRVVHAGANRVLLYASGSGNSLLAAIDGGGQITTLANPRLTRGWTVLAPTGHGLFVGVGADGVGQVLRSTASAVEPVGSIKLGGGGWTNAARYARGAVLLNQATGAALIAELTPEGRLVSSTPFKLPAGASLAGID
jgi:hypothetical protein